MSLWISDFVFAAFFLLGHLLCCFNVGVQERVRSWDILPWSLKGKSNTNKDNSCFFSTRCHMPPSPIPIIPWHEKRHAVTCTKLEGVFIPLRLAYLIVDCAEAMGFVGESREKQLHPPFTPPFLQHFLQKVFMTPQPFWIFSNKPSMNQPVAINAGPGLFHLHHWSARQTVFVDHGAHSIHRREQVASSHRKESKSRLGLWAERNGRYWWSNFCRNSQLFLISLWKKTGWLTVQSSATCLKYELQLGRLWWQGDRSGATRGGCQLRSWRDRAFQRRWRPIRWIFDAARNDICRKKILWLVEKLTFSWDGLTLLSYEFC